MSTIKSWGHNLWPQVEKINIKLKLYAMQHLEIITQKISEKEFILKYGIYLDFSFQNPHYYSFPFDSGRIIVSFKNGKLFSMEIIYYC